MTYSYEFRMATVKCYEIVQSIRKTACIFSISTSTVSRWMSTRGVLRGRSARSKITPDIINLIRIVISSDPFITSSRLADAILNGTGVNVSRQLTSTAIRRAGITRKRSRLRPVVIPMRREQRVQQFLAGISGHSVEDFVDEVGFRSIMPPLYGYSQKGSRLVCRRGNGSWHKLTAIVAISMDGVIGLQIQKENAKHHNFAKFINDMSTNSGQVIVMDNLSVHKHSLVKKAIADKEMTFVLTPPAEPDFNPIENAFSVLKTKYRKLCMLGPAVPSLDQVRSTVLRSFACLRQDIVIACIHRAQKVWAHEQHETI